MSSTIFFFFSFQKCITQYFIICLNFVVGQLTFFNNTYKMKTISQPLNNLKEGPFISHQHSFSPITSIQKSRYMLLYINQYIQLQNFKIPVPYDLVESNKLAPLHEEVWQGDQHKHAIIPCIKHHLEPL